jgi:hypothetical protein
LEEAKRRGAAAAEEEEEGRVIAAILRLSSFFLFFCVCEWRVCSFAREGREGVGARNFGVLGV